MNPSIYLLYLPQTSGCYRSPDLDLSVYEFLHFCVSLLSGGEQKHLQRLQSQHIKNSLAHDLVWRLLNANIWEQSEIDSPPAKAKPGCGFATPSVILSTSISQPSPLSLESVSRPKAIWGEGNLLPASSSGTATHFPQYSWNPGMGWVGKDLQDHLGSNCLPGTGLLLEPLPSVFPNTAVWLLKTKFIPSLLDLAGISKGCGMRSVQELQTDPRGRSRSYSWGKGKNPEVYWNKRAGNGSAKFFFLTGVLIKTEACQAELWFGCRDGSGGTGMSQWNQTGRQRHCCCTPAQLTENSL